MQCAEAEEELGELCAVQVSLVVLPVELEVKVEPARVRVTDDLVKVPLVLSWEVMEGGVW